MPKIRKPDPTFRYQIMDKCAETAGTVYARQVVAIAGPGKISDERGLVPVSRPRADGRHPQSVVAGAMHRFGCEMPAKDPYVSKVFLAFAKMYFMARFKPLPPGTDISRLTWLGKATYSAGRINQLRIAGCGVAVLTGTSLSCMSFIKAEGYDSFKYPRPINSYSDRFKYLMGGICRAIDEVIFNDPAFVKHVPTNERPQLLYDTFKDMAVLASDYTSMESHHNGIYAEFGAWWYGYMCQHVTMAPEIRRTVEEQFVGMNYCKFTNVIISVLAKLMSGAFWTSSANTVLNLTINSFMFAVSKVGIDAPIEDLVAAAMLFKIKVEGDDALMESFDVDLDLVDKLGLLFKFERFDSFGPASFCGIKVDVDTMQNMTDPRRVYAELGVYDSWWKDAKESTLLEMLRCKGLSILASFPACPLVTELGLYAVRVTAHIGNDRAARHLDAYKRERLGPNWARSVTSANISLASRATFAEYYGISIDDQLDFERRVRETQGLSLPWIDLGFPEDWYHYASQYCLPHGVDVENEWYPQLYPVELPTTKRPIAKRLDLPSWNEIDV